MPYPEDIVNDEDTPHQKNRELIVASICILLAAAALVFFFGPHGG